VRYNADGTLDYTFDSVNTLNGAPSYVENGAPVVLDGDVQVYDAELAAQGDYAGARLTLARHGGASAEDLFRVRRDGRALHGRWQRASHRGNAFATFSSAAGTLTIDFTSAAALATNALVNNVLQRITYANASDTPPPSVQVDYDFSDAARRARSAPSR
jgi:hypothetical protein